MQWMQGERTVAGYWRNSAFLSSLSKVHCSSQGGIFLADKLYLNPREYLQVIDVGARVFEGQAGLGVPQGLARFCSGPVWAEATLLCSLYRAACSRKDA